LQYENPYPTLKRATSRKMRQRIKDGREAVVGGKKRGRGWK